MTLKKKLSLNGLLYVIIDKKIADKASINIIDLASQIAQSAADLIQLRAKNISDADFLSLAKKLSFIFKKENKIFIVNDRADIAYLSGADGLHLGQSDISPREARCIIGEKALLGRTIHNCRELTGAIQKSSDYLGLGPFFSSKTKQLNRCPLNEKEIKKITTKNKKVIFAIGGINRYNVFSVLKSGIRNIAVSSAVILAACPKKEIKEIKKCLKKVS